MKMMPTYEEKARRVLEDATRLKNYHTLHDWLSERVEDGAFLPLKRENPVVYEALVRRLIWLSKHAGDRPAVDAASHPYTVLVLIMALSPANASRGPEYFSRQVVLQRSAATAEDAWAIAASVDANEALQGEILHNIQRLRDTSDLMNIHSEVFICTKACRYDRGEFYQSFIRRIGRE